jgi:hypothetical protein
MRNLSQLCNHFPTRSPTVKKKKKSQIKTGRDSTGIIPNQLDFLHDPKYFFVKKKGGTRSPKSVHTDISPQPTLTQKKVKTSSLFVDQKEKKVNLPSPPKKIFERMEHNSPTTRTWAKE